PLSGRRALDSPTRPVKGGRSFMGDGPARRSRRSRGPTKGVFGRLSAVVVLVLLAAGCATKGDIRSLRSEVQTLAVQQEEMLETIRAMQEAQTSSLDSLGAVSDVLFTLRGELNRQILEIQEQLVTIQELTGQSQRSLAGLRDQIEARRSAITQQESVAADTSGQTGGPAAQQGGGGGGAGGAADAQELYRVAVSQYNRGSVTTARAAFERFLNSYPNHQLAPDARYYLAEILYQENQLEDALAAFLEIPEIFPNAERVPRALYRAGVIQEELGNTGEARSLYERVVNTYPDSGVAILAEERLGEL
ncbi:MAG: tol-pal system protein YbgF, partial [Longimicrobiales bacterium]|nr:tol-pal system protein YbgF [Longimicrobiales bacterium]